MFGDIFPWGNDNNEKNNNTDPVCVRVINIPPGFCKYIPSFQIGTELNGAHYS